MKIAVNRNRQASIGEPPKQNPGLNRASTKKPKIDYHEASAIIDNWPTGMAEFNINSISSRIWLAQLRENTEARYGQPHGSACRALQTGYGWRSFLRVFKPLNAIEMVRLFENLLRLSHYEADLPARSFFMSYAPLVFEHDISGEYIGPGVWNPHAGCQDARQRIRRTLKRWSEWMEALVHFQVHAAGFFKSADGALDQLIIFLWPLIKRHHWNSRDLRRVLLSLTDCDDRYPCQSAEQLAAYCHHVLGLRWRGTKALRATNLAAVLPVAQRLYKLLPAIT
jgi:hypothetical protein